MFGFFCCCRKKRIPPQVLAFEQSVSTHEKFVADMHAELTGIESSISGMTLLDDVDEESRKVKVGLMIDTKVRIDELKTRIERFQSEDQLKSLNVGLAFMRSNDEDLSTRTQTLLVSAIPSMLRRLENAKTTVEQLSEGVKMNTPRPT